jgi:hypothetical protein
MNYGTWTTLQAWPVEQSSSLLVGVKQIDDGPPIAGVACLCGQVGTAPKNFGTSNTVARYIAIRLHIAKLRLCCT